MIGANRCFIAFVAKLLCVPGVLRVQLRPFRFIWPCPSVRMGKRAARSQKGCISLMSAPHVKLSRSIYCFRWPWSCSIRRLHLQRHGAAGDAGVTQEFMVDASWVPASMTAFLLGGALLSWLTGPCPTASAAGRCCCWRRLLHRVLPGHLPGQLHQGLHRVAPAAA